MPKMSANLSIVEDDKEKINMFIEHEKEHSIQCMPAEQIKLEKKTRRSVGYYIDYYLDIEEKTETPDKIVDNKNTSTSYFLPLGDEEVKVKKPPNRKEKTPKGTDINESYTMQASDGECESAKLNNSYTSKVNLETEDASRKFVRLSDIDRRFLSLLATPSPKMTQSTVTVKGESVLSFSINDLHTENVPSLLRVFPALKDQLTKSTPVIFNISGREIPCCTPHTVVPFTNYKPSTTFASDLLAIFLNEMCWDIVVLADAEQTIKAHKTILASRCQYFASLFSGDAKHEDQIDLERYQFKTVHYAISYMYAGAIPIPEDVDITDLAALSVQLMSDGLTSSLNDVLTRKHCHNFHKPCYDCTESGLECLLMLYKHRNDLFDKTLAWVKKYINEFFDFIPLYPYPQDLIEKIFKGYVVDLNNNTVMDTIESFGTMLNIRVEETKRISNTLTIAHPLVQQCILYLSKNLTSYISSEEFLLLRDQSDLFWSSLLNDCLMAGAERANDSEVLRAYNRLDDLTINDGQKLWITLSNELAARFEKSLIRSVLIKKRQPQWILEKNVLKPALKMHIMEVLSAVRLSTRLKLVKCKPSMKYELINTAVEEYYAKEATEHSKKKRESATKLLGQTYKPVPKPPTVVQVKKPISNKGTATKVVKSISAPLERPVTKKRNEMVKSSHSERTVVSTINSKKVLTVNTNTESNPPTLNVPMVRIFPPQRWSNRSKIPVPIKKSELMKSSDTDDYRERKLSAPQRRSINRKWY